MSDEVKVGETWGDIARHHKDLQGMSMSSLAREAGVSYPTLIKYLNNERTLPRDTSVVYRIAEALGLDPKILVEPMVLAATKGNGGDMSAGDRQFLRESIARELSRRASKGEKIAKIDPNVVMEYAVDVSQQKAVCKPIATWTVPEAIIADLVGPVGFWRVVDGDMEPTILKTAKTLVDFGHKRPVPDGVYLLDDGVSATLRRVTRVSSKRLWTISSDACETTAEVDFAADDCDFKIVGRAVSTLNAL